MGWEKINKLNVIKRREKKRQLEKESKPQWENYLNWNRHNIKSIYVCVCVGSNRLLNLFWNLEKVKMLEALNIGCFILRKIPSTNKMEFYFVGKKQMLTNYPGVSAMEKYCILWSNGCATMWFSISSYVNYTFVYLLLMVFVKWNKKKKDCLP